LYKNAIIRFLTLTTPKESEGKLVCGMEGGSYTGDFDRRKKQGPSGGAPLCEGFHEGDLEGGLVYWGN